MYHAVVVEVSHIKTSADPIIIIIIFIIAVTWILLYGRVYADYRDRKPACRRIASVHYGYKIGSDRNSMCVVRPNSLWWSKKRQTLISYCTVVAEVS